MCCFCPLYFTSLKMATWLAETCISSICCKFRVCINRVYTSLKRSSGYFTVPFISSLTEKDQNWLHASPVYAIPQHISCIRHSTAHHSIETTFYLLIFYTDFCDTVLTMNLTKNHKIFKSGLIPTHCNCNYILVFTSLKMVTRVVVTCLWSLCNEITFIISGAFVSLFKEIFIRGYS
jgi:hypothetical protein